MLPQTLRADKLRELTQVLSMAVGLSSERGDEIAISSLDQFAAGASAPAAAKAEPEAEAAQPQTQPGAPSTRSLLRALADNEILVIAVIAVLVVAALIVALMSLAGAGRKPSATTLTSDERDRLLAQMRQWLGVSQG
jgi:flagellar biosynthesis/type III secretory pathway M-ring protein FliF/YscJ